MSRGFSVSGEFSCLSRFQDVNEVNFVLVFHVELLLLVLSSNGGQIAKLPLTPPPSRKSFFPSLASRAFHFLIMSS